MYSSYAAAISWRSKPQFRGSPDGDELAFAALTRNPSASLLLLNGYLLRRSALFLLSSGCGAVWAATGSGDLLPAKLRRRLDASCSASWNGGCRCRRLYYEGYGVGSTCPCSPDPRCCGCRSRGGDRVGFTCRRRGFRPAPSCRRGNEPRCVYCSSCCEPGSEHRAIRPHFVELDLENGFCEGDFGDHGCHFRVSFAGKQGRIDDNDDHDVGFRWRSSHADGKRAAGQVRRKHGDRGNSHSINDEVDLREKSAWKARRGRLGGEESQHSPDDWARDKIHCCHCHQGDERRFAGARDERAGRYDYDHARADDLVMRNDVWVKGGEFDHVHANGRLVSRRDSRAAARAVDTRKDISDYVSDEERLVRVRDSRSGVEEKNRRRDDHDYAHDGDRFVRMQDSGAATQAVDVRKDYSVYVCDDELLTRVRDSRRGAEEKIHRRDDYDYVRDDERNVRMKHSSMAARAVDVRKDDSDYVHDDVQLVSARDSRVRPEDKNVRRDDYDYDHDDEQFVKRWDSSTSARAADVRKYCSDYTRDHDRLVRVRDSRLRVEDKNVQIGDYSHVHDDQRFDRKQDSRTTVQDVDVRRDDYSHVADDERRFRGRASKIAVQDISVKRDYYDDVCDDERFRRITDSRTGLQVSSARRDDGVYLHNNEQLVKKQDLRTTVKDVDVKQDHYDYVRDSQKVARNKDSRTEVVDVNARCNDYAYIQNDERLASQWDSRTELRNWDIRREDYHYVHDDEKLVNRRDSRTEVRDLDIRQEDYHYIRGDERLVNRRDSRTEVQDVDIRRDDYHYIHDDERRNNRRDERIEVQDVLFRRKHEDNHHRKPGKFADSWKSSQDYSVTADDFHGRHDDDYYDYDHDYNSTHRRQDILSNVHDVRVVTEDDANQASSSKNMSGFKQQHLINPQEAGQVCARKSFLKPTEVFKADAGNSGRVSEVNSVQSSLQFVKEGTSEINVQSERDQRAANKSSMKESSERNMTITLSGSNDIKRRTDYDEVGEKQINDLSTSVVNVTHVVRDKKRILNQQVIHETDVDVENVTHIDATKIQVKDTNYADKSQIRLEATKNDQSSLVLAIDPVDTSGGRQVTSNAQSVGLSGYAGAVSADVAGTLQNDLLSAQGVRHRTNSIKFGDTVTMEHTTTDNASDDEVDVDSITFARDNRKTLKGQQSEKLLSDRDHISQQRSGNTYKRISSSITGSAVSEDAHQDVSSLTARKDEAMERAGMENLQCLRSKSAFAGDVLDSGAQSQQFATSYVGEFMDRLQQEISKPDAPVTDKESRIGKVMFTDPSSTMTRMKGPSDEMWDVQSSTSHETFKTTDFEEHPSVVGATSSDSQTPRTDILVVQRPHKSMWAQLFDIIRLGWLQKDQSQNSEKKSSGRESSGNSARSEHSPSGQPNEIELRLKGKKSALDEQFKAKKGNTDAFKQEERTHASETITLAEIDTTNRGSSKKSPPLDEQESQQRRATMGTSNLPSVDFVTGGSSVAVVDLVVAGSSTASVTENIQADIISAGIHSDVSPDNEQLPAAVENISSVAAGLRAGESAKSVESRVTNDSPPQAISFEEQDVNLRRRLHRTKQVVKGTFDEWEEAHQHEAQVRKMDEMFMREALDEAQRAADAWEVPVGAVLVLNGEIVARGYNLVEDLRDSTAHAEMICIREASNQLRNWRLSDTTLYVTLEPCAMCAGAILQARIGTVVWGAPNKLLGADGSWVRLFPGGGEASSLDPSSQAGGPVHPLHPRITIRRGVLASECAEIMQQFFQLRRKKDKKPPPPLAPPHPPPAADPKHGHHHHHHLKLFTKLHNMFAFIFCM